MLRILGKLEMEKFLFIPLTKLLELELEKKTVMLSNLTLQELKNQ